MQYLWLEWIVAFLAAVGAINWSFYKFLNLDIVDFLLIPERNKQIKLLVYFLISLSGLYLLVNLFWK